MLIAITLLGALPMYGRIADMSPHGQGSILVLERLFPRWKGKAVVLCLLGFAATDFVIPPHRTLAEIEKMAILQTLQRTNWNKQEAAQILGLYRPTLYSKMKKHEIQDGGKSGARRAAGA